MSYIRYYNIIYLDPPWQYNNFTDSKNGAAVSQYDTLSLEELKNIPIADITARNCACIMWITHPKMVEGAHVELFKAWGFRPVSTLFNWVKTNKNGSPYMGVGFYTRGDSELCLLGIKGRMKVLDHSIRQTIIAPRGRHSEKPNDIVREKISQLFGNHSMTQLEIFSRQQVLEWDCLGNNINGFDIRKARTAEELSEGIIKWHA